MCRDEGEKLKKKSNEEKRVHNSITYGSYSCFVPTCKELPLWNAKQRCKQCGCVGVRISQRHRCRDYGSGHASWYRINPRNIQRLGPQQRSGTAVAVPSRSWLAIRVRVAQAAAGVKASQRGTFWSERQICTCGYWSTKTCLGTIINVGNTRIAFVGFALWPP